MRRMPFAAFADSWSFQSHSIVLAGTFRIQDQAKGQRDDFTFNDVQGAGEPMQYDDVRGGPCKG